MPNQFDLTNEYVSSTYGRVVQIVSSSLYDGFGNLVYLNFGANISTREEVIIGATTSSYSYTLAQTPQSGSVALIYYNGILLNQSSYSSTGSIYTLDSNFEVYTDDILTFLYTTSGSGGGSSTSSSYSDYAATASYLLGSISSASYSNYAVTASYANTASYYNGPVTSASYALSASYAPVPETSSYSLFALSASWAPGSNSISSSYSVSSSYSDMAASSSYAISSSWAPFQQSSSFAETANTASYYNGTVISSSHAINSDTSSYIRNAESASYYGGSVASSSYASTSSYSNSSSYAPAQPTSSYSLMALSASWAPPPGATISSSYSNNSSTSDVAISASNAVIASTASYYNGNVESSSYADTSSYSNQSLSSSYSTFVPYIQTIGSRISTEDSYITAGSKGYKHIGFKSSIVKARTITNETGSIDVNIKRNGTLLGNINITSSTGSYDNILSGWTSQLNEDDLIEFYVSGSSTYITDITIFIDIKARQ